MAQTGQPGGAAAGLRAEVRPLKTLYFVGEPVPVCFELHNGSDTVVEIPVQRWSEAADAGVGLPVELVIGTPDRPALHISFQGEKPVPVQPNVPRPAARRVEPLRLGPRGSVGVQVDLREWYRALRYPGQYELKWRLPGDAEVVATATLRVQIRRDAVIVTDYGKMTFSLLYEQAPRNVENFLELAERNFYNGSTFHRIVPGEHIQGGRPGSGTGEIRPDGKLVPAEFHDWPFERGTLAMARKESDPNSASCQFFITLARLPRLDGRYTVIGQARDEESLRTLEAIERQPTDAHFRPVRPVTIRTITLVPAEESSPPPPAAGHPPPERGP